MLTKKEQLNDDVLSLMDFINEQSESLEKATINVDQLKEEKSQMKSKLRFLKSKVAKLCNNPSDVSSVKNLEDEVKYLGGKVNSLVNENKELQELLSLLEDDNVVTFEDGRYTNDIREVIMKLLSLNVSMKKVNSVIKVVLEGLAKKKVDRLPSAGVQTRILSGILVAGTDASCLLPHLLLDESG